ncbi:hypothetical protein CDAR_85301 [Caerostris darwini]|uniref:Uncharacterized protein n=1 Tax=Caerostris darwini TaxID=1538125 RepID=A0AAV4SZW1_9ARAC|nr:hypothetical protein CDAR_85301 [Caerostris darwini]
MPCEGRHSSLHRKYNSEKTRFTLLTLAPLQRRTERTFTRLSPSVIKDRNYRDARQTRAAWFTACHQGKLRSMPLHVCWMRLVNLAQKCKVSDREQDVVISEAFNTAITFNAAVHASISRGRKAVAAN